MPTRNGSIARERDGRSQVTRLQQLRVFGIAAGLAALCAARVAADLAAWDQPRVTAIAQQLAAACDAWEQVVRQQPDPMIGSGEVEEGGGLLQSARLLRVQSSALAGHLAKGRGRDETLDFYRSLKEMVDDSEDDARRLSLSGATLDAWSKLADLMRQVAPYYDPKALPGAK